MLFSMCIYIRSDTGWGDYPMQLEVALCTRLETSWLGCKSVIIACKSVIIAPLGGLGGWLSWRNTLGWSHPVGWSTVYQVRDVSVRVQEHYHSLPIYLTFSLSYLTVGTIFPAYPSTPG
jgi:hypothetical protein